LRLASEKKGLSQKPFFKQENPLRNSFFSTGFLIFWIFFLKQAVLFRLLQMVMGDGDQPPKKICGTFDMTKHAFYLDSSPA